MSQTDDRETVASEGGLATDETVVADASTGPGARPSAAVVRGGRQLVHERLGRYTILRVLGQGGMGEVLEGFDPELGRRVAIKVLHDARNATALKREAQALARLEHPNVVAVYDVGSTEDGVFVVMQLIDGDRIDRWLRTRQAGARAILAAFRQAGLGLAAAHAAGLVHCDFKPSNVLVDRDGAVRVGDFGLARGAGEGGEIAGTPPYMAPEQFAGAVTAATDQFAFCAALWELLAGELPYEPISLHGGAQRAAARPRRPMPRTARVPAKVVRALERGLAADPAARWPSMHELLAAFAPRRPGPLAVGAGVALVAGGAAVALAIGHRAPPAPVSVPAAASTPAELPPPRLDLTHARALTSYGTAGCAFSPTITPDGTVVFDRTVGDAVDLYAVPLAGGTPRRLTSAPTWEWRASPGRHPGEVLHLIQQSQELAGASIATLELATGRETPVVDVFARDAAAVGDAIYYIPSKQTEIRVWRGGRDVALVSNATGLVDLAASPTGQQLAAIEHLGKAPAQLCLVGVRDGHMTCARRDVLSARPAFGSGGQNIYYAKSDGIHAAATTSSRDEVVVPNAAAVGGIAVAPDDGSLVYSDCGTRSMLIDATAPGRAIVDDRSAMAPSTGPGSILAWTREDRGGRVLMVRTSTGRIAQLTEPSLCSVKDPAVSPGGDYVAFRCLGAHPGIHVTMIAGADDLQVTDDADDASIVWVDRTTLAFVRHERSGAYASYTVSWEGGGLHRLSTGRRFLYGMSRGRLVAGDDASMLSIDPHTGAERAGPASPPAALYVGVSPNGSWIAYVTETTPAEVWRMPLGAPGRLERVLTLAPGEASISVAITDDGHPVLAEVSWSGDLHAIPAAAGTQL